MGQSGGYRFVLRRATAVCVTLAGAAALVLCSSCIGQDAAGRMAAADTFDVSVKLRRASVPAAKTHPIDKQIVVWLTPAGAKAVVTHLPARYTMIQQGKQFSPHLLVVPTGSTVSFPNADPFFHNVFSLFNGKRFDLGLYQAGQTRDITFGRPGVSYIFCNIHPEMSAVIISLSTPYFAVSDGEGTLTLHGVPEGKYTLEVWSESASPDSLRALSRSVSVGKNNSSLGEVVVPASGSAPGDHLNKFGVPYEKHVPPKAY